MRLIDADVLKEIVGECPENWTDSPEEVKEFNMWHRIMDDIDSTPTVGGWISVEDKLPEEGTWVLACEKDGFMFVDVRYDGKWRVGAQALAVITHWMPLPELPEEVSEHE